MLEHSGDEDDRRTSRKSESPPAPACPTSSSHHGHMTSRGPTHPNHQLSHSPVAPSPSSSFFLQTSHAGFLHPSVLSSVQPSYIFTRPPWQIIPPSVLSHLRRRPALPLFVLTTIPAHLLLSRPALTTSSFSFSPHASLRAPPAVPRSSSNLENTERKRVKTRLKKLMLKRPPLQALQEKGLIKGGIPF